MCIVIHKPANKNIRRHIYEGSYRNNPHGAGFAYVKNNELVIEKGFFKLRDVVDKLMEHESDEMIVHFRVASPGMVINEENCHPFRVDSKSFPHMSFAIVHNGRLPWRNTQTHSDTYQFVNQFLKGILDHNPFLFDHWQYCDMLKDYIGAGNKIAVMRHDSESKTTNVYIINEDKGTKMKGCWFSNFSHLGLYDGLRSDRERDFHQNGHDGNVNSENCDLYELDRSTGKFVYLPRTSKASVVIPETKEAIVPLAGKVIDPSRLVLRGIEQGVSGLFLAEIYDPVTKITERCSIFAAQGPKGYELVKFTHTPHAAVNPKCAFNAVSVRSGNILVTLTMNTEDANADPKKEEIVGGTFERGHSQSPHYNIPRTSLMHLDQTSIIALKRICEEYLKFIRVDGKVSLQEKLHIVRNDLIAAMPDTKDMHFTVMDKFILENENKVLEALYKHQSWMVEESNVL
jgi:predicted glutamine amidotransferase